MSTLSQFFPAGGSVPSNAIPIQLLVVGGGGGATSGSSNQMVGGSGAGRYIHIANAYVIPSVAYSVIIGAGGSSGNGSESSFGSLIIAPGGAGGTFQATPGVGGSSAGGGMNWNSGGFYPQTPLRPGAILAPLANGSVSSKIYFGPDTVIENLGHQGAPGVFASSAYWAGAGGGAGGTAFPGGSSGGANQNVYSYASAPGSSVANDITGSLKYYAGGGGGSSSTTVFSTFSTTVAMAASRSNGAVNTGGGSGGALNVESFTGGSGVVVVAYSTAYSSASTTGSPSTPARSGFRVYEFTGSGTITFAL